MSRFTVLLALALAGCVFVGFGRPPDPASGNLRDWRFATGKPPTRIEYIAEVAACRDGTILDAQSKPLDSCLADLGLRRIN
ncbi:MAG TPA: hypothetical protein VME41_12135 [Stellaceae bacterium]|nr:hypothetical protein [Stellaceae bacterium]